MDIVGFSNFLTQRNFSKEDIAAIINRLQDYESFLETRNKSLDTSTTDDFYAYADHLIQHDQSDAAVFVSMLRYAYYKKNNTLYRNAMEVLDGSEVIRNLSARLTDEFDEETRKNIFQDIEEPPLGIHPRKKPDLMKPIIERLEKKLGPQKCAEFLNHGLRDRYEESRQPDRKKFLQLKNIDAFLFAKRKEFIKQLEHHHKNGTLFFTQEITPEVLEHVKNDPYIETGVREEDKIIIRKIPHMAKEYLAETDDQKKRYFYCHCPWVKEALLADKKPVSPVFCNCSAGFYRAYWEIVLAQPVEVEVLSSLLRSDPICSFAVSVPENLLEQTS
jgi:hypothetical protein